MRIMGAQEENILTSCQTVDKDLVSGIIKIQQKQFAQMFLSKYDMHMANM